MGCENLSVTHKNFSFSYFTRKYDMLKAFLFILNSGVGTGHDTEVERILRAPDKTCQTRGVWADSTYGTLYTSTTSQYNSQYDSCWAVWQLLQWQLSTTLWQHTTGAIKSNYSHTWYVCNNVSMRSGLLRIPATLPSPKKPSNSSCKVNQKRLFVNYCIIFP